MYQSSREALFDYGCRLARGDSRPVDIVEAVKYFKGAL
jgi:hypothetical protein